MALLGLGLVCGALPGCRVPTTEVLVELDSDIDPSRALTIRAAVIDGAGTSGGSTQAWVRGGSGADAITLPASFAVLAPSRERLDARVTLVLDAEIAAVAGGAPMRFRRVVRFALTPHATTRVPVFLSATCASPATGCARVADDQCTVGELCDEQNLTCGDQGACVPTEVMPTPVTDASVADAHAIDAPPAQPDAVSVSPDAVSVPPDGVALVDAPRADAPTDGPPADAPRDAGCVGDSGGCASSQPSCAGSAVAGCGTVTAGLSTASFSLGELGAAFATPVVANVTVRGSLEVDAYEVTVARFRRYWSAGHPGAPAAVPYPGGTMLAWSGPVIEPLPGGTTPAGSVCNWTSAPSVAHEGHPINCVDWQTAQAFCVWDGGGRLPTEAEWEWIARWRTSPSLAAAPRHFPWGATAPAGSAGGACTLAHFAACVGDDGLRTRRVGAFGATGGLYDLAGNLAEWAADQYDDYGNTPCWGTGPHANPVCVLRPSDARVARGGSHASAMPELLANAARVANIDFDRRSDEIGFRCVRDR